MKSGIIYLTVNKLNGKKYVGQTIKKGRALESYFGSGIALQRAIEKHGLENFEKVILKNCDSKEELDEEEKFWIAYIDPEYNIAEGGEGGNTLCRMSEEDKIAFSEKVRERWASLSEDKRNKIVQQQKDSWTEERKLVHSVDMKERWNDLSEDERKRRIEQLKSVKPNTMSQESRQKISDSLSGKILTSEHKTNISEGRKGKVHSDTTKRKIRQGNLKHYIENGKFVVLEDLMSGETQIFYGVKDAGRKTGYPVTFFTCRLKDDSYIGRKKEYRSKRVRYATEIEKQEYLSENLEECIA